MPFKSEAQRRKFYAMEEKGEIPKGTTSRWEKDTKDKTLPERVKKESAFSRAVVRMLAREKGAAFDPRKVEGIKQVIQKSLSRAKATDAARYKKLVPHLSASPKIQSIGRQYGIAPEDMASIAIGKRQGVVHRPKFAEEELPHDLSASNPTKLTQKIQEMQEAEFHEGIRRSKEAKERIPGGLASGKPDSAFPAEQLRQGTKVEKEHSPSTAIAKEIAKDHIEEHRNYYPELAKMEAKLERKKESALIRVLNKQSASECDTPGEKIRSKGKGRGLAVGKGKGPIGGRGALAAAVERQESTCDTPGEKKRSEGKGRGLARGGGGGPMGRIKGMLGKEKLSAEQQGAALYGSDEGFNYLSAILKEASLRYKQAAGLDPLEEQRKQQLHEQQMQFAEDRHQLEMQQLQMQMEQQQAATDMKQQQMQQSFEQDSAAKQEQAAQMQQMQQPTPGGANPQQDAQRRQNLLASQSPPPQQ